MTYLNPVIKGFYPDPSVCFANGKFYLVASSFQYFPGVPLFESDNLVNWKQIGYVLTRKSQIMLEKINSSGGVFAPTIRYNNGRFYMVTTNDTTHQNFYVYTDDIYGEWSEPVYVEQNGIDPSLYFENDKAYFMSNGTDDKGMGGVVQCEIDILTGKKLSESKCIWQGSGGRYLESPHLYKINGAYYLMAAEGGTEYGHMVTLAKSSSVWGEFESCPFNPILTNRNKAPNIIQGIGHGDLICGKDGQWHILSLGFRQIHMWQPYHNLGREIFLTPVSFDDNGWIHCGNDGTTDDSYEISGDFTQQDIKNYTFENTDMNIDWCFMRHPNMKNYEFDKRGLTLRGCSETLDDTASPTFIALRQRDFCGNAKCKVNVCDGIGGMTMYMCEDEHYDIFLRKCNQTFEAVLKLNIGGIKHEQTVVSISSDTALLHIDFDNMGYSFSVETESGIIPLGYGFSKYLSSEVSGGFTGTMLGLFAIDGTSHFSDFSCTYSK